MAVNDAIYELRMKAKITQEEFAHTFHVSRQAVQKWENGTATPELSKLIEISKYFATKLSSLTPDSSSDTISIFSSLIAFYPFPRLKKVYTQKEELRRLSQIYPQH